MQIGRLLVTRENATVLIIPVTGGGGVGECGRLTLSSQ